MTRKPTSTTADQLRQRAIIHAVIALETLQRDMSHKGAVKANGELLKASAACQEMEFRIGFADCREMDRRLVK